MNVLAIESSCDETAAAIISGDPSLLQNRHSDNANAFSLSQTHQLGTSDSPLQTRPKLLSNVVVSQIDIFKAYGGVIPEVAARSHLEAILPVIHQAFREAGFAKEDSSDDWSKIDAIAVTHTPGLLGSLLIGTLTARTLAILHQKPLYAVHHLKSHIYANWLGQGSSSQSTSKATTDSSAHLTSKSAEIDITLPSFPLLSLVISGGHTQIIYMKRHNHFEIIGTTLDDAVGECFDKVAKILGLPYPGGPAISKAASGEIIDAKTGEITKTTPGDPHRYPLPHPKIAGLNFSFSGLKTAVLRAVQKEVNVPISYPSHELADLLSAQQKADFAASFEETACDILLEKLVLAQKLHPDVKSFVIAGGVSANQRLREKAASLFVTNSTPDITAKTTPKSTSNAPSQSVFFPELRFSGDNAAMVGAAAFYEIASGVRPTDPYSLNILPRSEIR